MNKAESLTQRKRTKTVRAPVASAAKPSSFLPLVGLPDNNASPAALPAESSSFIPFVGSSENADAHMI